MIDESYESQTTEAVHGFSCVRVPDQKPLEASNLNINVVGRRNADAVKQVHSQDPKVRLVRYTVLFNH